MGVAFRAWTIGATLQGAETAMTLYKKAASVLRILGDFEGRSVVMPHLPPYYDSSLSKRAWESQTVKFRRDCREQRLQQHALPLFYGSAVQECVHPRSTN